MARIGIMGGTFNPPHNVHLIMAEEARRQFKLKKVLFMPSKNPPHKEKDSIASDEDRKRMIKHAIQNHPHFYFSELELEREGTTYTKDTLKELKKRYPDDKFYFIMGGDSLESLETWRDPAYIMAHCRILAAGRGKTGNKELRDWIAYYQKKYGAKIRQIEMPLFPVSSEMIRERINRGDSISDYVPAPVEDYIKFNNLYGFAGTMFHELPSDREIIRVLSANLKPGRLLHTLGVAATAANMAAVHGCDERKAYVAGLLHDCAKYFTGAEQIRLCDQKQIPLSETERSNPAIIHGKLGARLARDKYLVTDEEILSAITWHTTGRPGMTCLEKIIYLADYVEPARSMKTEPYPLKEIRRACFTDLDRAMEMVLTCVINYLEETGDSRDPITEETYHFYHS